MSIETNRRAFIAAIPAVAAVAAAPAVAFAAPADRREWEQVMAKWRVAERTAQDHEANVFGPLHDRELAFERMHGLHRKWGKPGYFDKRDKLIRKYGTDHVVPTAINDEHDRLWDAENDARWEAIATPAPDQAALRWKLDYLFADDGSGSTDSWSVEHVKQVFADIARLLPQGR